MRQFSTKNEAPQRNFICTQVASANSKSSQLVCTEKIQVKQCQDAAITKTTTSKRSCVKKDCSDQSICGLLTSDYFKQTDPLTQPFPDGPYAVDHFQIARDNVQLRSPVKYTVASVPDLQVSPIETIMVDGAEYFGRVDATTGEAVYLTYPLPVTLDVYVPSTRTDRDTTYDFFPDEGPGSRYSGYLSLEAQLLANATAFFTDGTIEQGIGTIMESQMNYVPDSNSLANLVLNTPLSQWTGLIGVFLLDDPNTDAYDRLVQLKADLASDLVDNALNAYYFLMDVAGSYGVPVNTANPNSVSAADRQQAIDLVIASSNFQRLKHFQTWAQRHGLSETKDDQTDQYQPQYDFTNISLINGQQARVVILGDPLETYDTDAFASKLASWGIAAANYSATYRPDNPRTPGKWRSATEILDSGQSFPDSTFLYGEPLYTDANGNGVYGNYEAQGENQNLISIYAGLIFSIGWNYAPRMSVTGTSAYEYNQDTIQTVIDMLTNAVDITGNLLMDRLHLTDQFGVFGLSGGSNALNGAHMINLDQPGTFRAGVAMDIVLNLPFWGFQNDDESEEGGNGNMYGEASIFPGPDGLNYFIQFLEPEIDWYSSNADGTNNSRFTVGSRLELQNLLRRTRLEFRSRSMYVEYAPTGHYTLDAGSILVSREPGIQTITGRGIRIADKPTFPDIHKDPVYGIQDTTNNRGDIDYATLNTFTLYLRSALSRFESISAAMFSFMPFKYQFAPWDIPGAYDYQWPYRFWQMDLGGDFRLRTNILPTETLVINGLLLQGNSDYPTFDVTDPETQVLYASLSFTGNSGKSTGDLDMFLINPAGDYVTASDGSSNPEHFYFDLREYTDEQKLGTWTIEVDGFASDNDYILTIKQGRWKLIMESELHPNDPSTLQLSLTDKTINISNLPTSSSGLTTGDLYSDGGVLKIVQ